MRPSDPQRELRDPISKPFAARYAGKCARTDCGDRFEIGEPIVRVERSGGGVVYVHAACPPPDDFFSDAEIDNTAGLPLCPKCFMYHRGECL